MNYFLVIMEMNAEPVAMRAFNAKEIRRLHAPALVASTTLNDLIAAGWDEKSIMNAGDSITIEIPDNTPLVG